MRVNRYFCFSDEAMGMAALAEAGLLVQDYETDPETGEQSPDGDPYLPPNGKGNGFDIFVRNLPVAGWHVDIWTALPLDGLHGYEVNPATPMFAC
jgi:hypothetical protein